MSLRSKKENTLHVISFFNQYFHLIDHHKNQLQPYFQPSLRPATFLRMQPIVLILFIKSFKRPFLSQHSHQASCFYPEICHRYHFLVKSSDTMLMETSFDIFFFKSTLFLPHLLHQQHRASEIGSWRPAPHLPWHRSHWG